MSDELTQLRSILAEARDLQAAFAVLDWDEQTYMPPRGGEARGDQKATLSRIAHQRFTSPRVGELLSLLESRDDLGELDRALVAVTRRDWDREVKVPDALVEAMARQASRSYRAWIQARDANDYRIFEPEFAATLALEREWTQAVGYAEHPYDAFLAGAEPGMSTRRLTELFGQLRRGLVPMVHAIAERQDRVDTAFLKGQFDLERQWELCMQVARVVGFDFDRGRQDRSVHPFTTSFSRDDVRITTRLDPEDVTAGLFASIHEAGHGLYEQGIPPELGRSPLGEGASGGMHESQSRLWENLVGRSRPFWTFFLPRLQALFPQFQGTGVEAMYRAVNRSVPSFVRMHADEVTYNLHIMLRVDLELRLITGKLATADLRDAWNERFAADFGITPPDDLHGVLQDIHWTSGLGVFPSYTLGNVIAAQLMAAARREIPDLDRHIERGELGSLLHWLRAHVHRFGRSRTPSEILVAATGRDLDAEPYLAYIAAKFGEIYGLG